MSKKQLYIIVGIFAIITIGFFLATFILSGGGKKTNTTTTNPFADFFGKSGTDTQNGNNTSTNQTNSGDTDIIPTYIGKKNLPILRQITEKPIAGLYATQKLGKPYVNYVEKETGNVFETRMEDMQTNRLSNAMMPRISQAYFTNQGYTVILRYLKNRGDIISSFVLEIPKTALKTSDTASSTTNLPGGRFLPSGIMDIKISTDEKTAFYLTRSDDFANRSSFGSVLSFEKNTVSDVFQSPFSEWLPIAFDGKNVFLQSKASQNVPGFLYSFDTKTGILKKILGNINGLTTLPSPDEKNILYSESTKGGLVLRIYNTVDKTTTNTTLQTLPEKCVWGSNNLRIYCAVPGNLPGTDYPDAWYQGIVSFSDNMWRIDVKTGKSSVILVPSSFTLKQLDISSPYLSSLQDFIYFINKKDSSLWAFEVGKTEE